jgi:hypothetical protein
VKDLRFVILNEVKDLRFVILNEVKDLQFAEMQVPYLLM